VHEVGQGNAAVVAPTPGATAAIAVAAKMRALQCPHRVNEVLPEEIPLDRGDGRALWASVD